MANLLLNAMDALPPQNGRIKITIDHDAEAGEVVLVVTDNSYNFV